MSRDRFPDEPPEPPDDGDDGWKDEFDKEASEQAREEGIDRVKRHREWFIQMAVGVAREIAVMRPEFTTDPICWILREREIDFPGDPRIMGAVMRQARKEEICEPTDRWHRTVRVSSHRRPLQVWKSLVYDDGCTAQ